MISAVRCEPSQNGLFLDGEQWHSTPRWRIPWHLVRRLALELELSSHQRRHRLWSMVTPTPRRLCMVKVCSNFQGVR